MKIFIKLILCFLVPYIVALLFIYFSSNIEFVHALKISVYPALVIGVLALWPVLSPKPKPDPNSFVEPIDNEGWHEGVGWAALLLQVFVLVGIVIPVIVSYCILHYVYDMGGWTSIGISVALDASILFTAYWILRLIIKIQDKRYRKRKRKSKKKRS